MYRVSVQYAALPESELGRGEQNVRLPPCPLSQDGEYRDELSDILVFFSF
jgi:hypothetical protein